MRDETRVAAVRFGFGLPLPEGTPVGREPMLASLAGPDPALSEGTAELTAAAMDRLRLFDDAAQARRRARRASGGEAPAEIEASYRAAGQAITGAVLDEARAALGRMVASPEGFRERLVLFWADHFTVSFRGASQRELPAALIRDAIRPNLTGRFADLLLAVETHPAMLIYLDQAISFGPNSEIGLKRGRGLNENLARELLELHTLGVGAGYTQDDVRQLAELLTGLVVHPSRGSIFIRRRAEPGPETVLGVTYPQDDADGMAPIRAVLSDLAARPETAAHLARKLAVHFVADDPDPALVGALEAAWRDSGGDLMAVYGALLAQPAAWAAPGAKVRPPVEFVAASLRALGIGTGEIAALEDRRLRALVLEPLATMGQPWQQPDGPDGWPEAAEDWITPQGLAARIRWAMEAPAALRPDLPDPRLLLDSALAGRAGERLAWAVAAAETRADGVGLLLASPEFNRR
jgi:uncharacterized protein (DUF1800 family)